MNNENKKALIVDDEIHIVQVVAIKLRNNGYEVFTAENGAEAFEIAQKQQPDIIITDFQMPAMTGLELVEKLRAKQNTAQTPVIILTARAFAIEQAQQEKLNIAACLSKPFSPREVLAKVEEVLTADVAI